VKEEVKQIEQNTQIQNQTNRTTGEVAPEPKKETTQQNPLPQKEEKEGKSEHGTAVVQTANDFMDAPLDYVFLVGKWILIIVALFF